MSPNIERVPCALCFLEQEAEMPDAGNIASFDCPPCGRYAVSRRAIAEFKRSEALRAAALKFVQSSQTPTHMAEFVFEFDLETQKERLVGRVVPRAKYH